MAEPILAEPILAEHIKGSINRNFCSSTLFLAPAVYSYIVNYSNVMWSSIICFITSAAHHYYQAQNKILRMVLPLLL